MKTAEAFECFEKSIQVCVCIYIYSAEFLDPILAHEINFHSNFKWTYTGWMQAPEHE
jgi:hypothetical protein